MIAFFANIFGYLLNFIYNLVENYGIAIIIFSILIKLAMIPISIKQQKTMKKSTRIQAKMKELQEKYKNNPEKLNQETLELYKNENMSPFSGCLSAIVQIILLFAVFYLVRSPLTYMKKVDADVISKYTKIVKQNDLSSNSAYPEIEIVREIDNIRALKNKVDETTEEADEDKISLTEIKEEELEDINLNMEFLGLNLAQIPTNSSDWKAYIIPILYVVVSVLSMKITTAAQKQKPETIENNDEKALTKAEEEFDPMAQMNKNMNMMFPVMYLAVALIAPLGLALYWLMNSLLMIVERLALNKLLKDEEEN